MELPEWSDINSMDFLDSTTWGKMLTDYRSQAELTKSALAQAVGVTISYISKLESGKTPPPENQRWALCEALGLSDDQAQIFHIKAELERADPTTVKYLKRYMELKTESQESSEQVINRSTGPTLPTEAENLHTIAIINKAAAGYPQGFTDLDYPVGVADGYIAVPDIADPNAFGFYAAGDSMEPDFADGTLLIASPNTPAFDGDPCFIRFSPTCQEGGCSFKKVYFMSNGQVRLVPLNRRYAEQVFQRDDLTGIWPVVRAYGKVNRGAERPIARRPKTSNRTPNDSADRTSSAAG
jgi:phage repressor protein C with HTH and peptisase S24 domain